MGQVEWKQDVHTIHIHTKPHPIPNPSTWNLYFNVLTDTFSYLSSVNSAWKVLAISLAQRSWHIRVKQRGKMFLAGWTLAYLVICSSALPSDADDSWHPVKLKVISKFLWEKHHCWFNQTDYIYSLYILFPFLSFFFPAYLTSDHFWWFFHCLGLGLNLVYTTLNYSIYKFHSPWPWLF